MRAYPHHVDVVGASRSFVRQTFLFWLIASCALLAIGLDGEDANHRDIAGPLLEESLGIGSLFEPQDDIIRVAHDYDLARSAVFSPVLCPKVENIM